MSADSKGPTFSESFGAIAPDGPGTSVGLRDAAGTVLELDATAIFDYDLQSSIGPVGLVGLLRETDHFASLGVDWDLTSAQNFSFQAITTASAPEPTAVMFLSAALLLLATVSRYRA